MAESFQNKCTWAKKKSQNEQQSPPVQSFIEIMSETLAEELQEKDLQEFDEDQKAIQASLELDDFQESNDCSRDFELALQLSQDPDYSVDAAIALELQRQFDREEEYERQQQPELPTEVQHSKKGKTITLGTDRFEYSKLEHELEQHGEEDFDEEREQETDNYYRVKVQEFPPCGFKRIDGNIITKHDKEIGQKRNCQKMMQFPTEFNSGDIMGQKISSRIYNDLQLHAKEERRRHARIKDKQEIATSDASVDVKSRLLLLNWINQGILDRVEGVIAIGKESTVLNGVCDSNEVGPSTILPSTERRFAIKVHKQVLNAFRNRSDYVKDDYRFKNPRKIMKIWANKEYLNLTRLFKAGLPCPEPINFKNNIVLMSLIQDEAGKPAPKLKNYIFTSDEEKLEIFNQVKEIMIKMFKCNLVHADLSEFNLLFSDEKIFVIDVAQSVDLSHPQALIFLQRDIENVLGFFEKNATEGLPTTHALFSEITDIKVDEEKDLLTQIESFNEQNLFTHLAKFRRTPGDYDLILLDTELEDMEFNDDSEESDKE